MKANKAKTSKKTAKKVSKRAVKKHLETSITDKFLEALKGLGHDAGKLSKEIKKTSRVLANKLADKYQEVKVAVEEKFESNAKPKRAKKPLTTAKRTVTSAAVKAEKVVAKATNIAAALKAKTAGKKPATRTVSARTSVAKTAAEKLASTRKAPAKSKAVGGGSDSTVKPSRSRTPVAKTSAGGKAAPVKKVSRARKPPVAPAVTPAEETSAPAPGNESEN